MKNAQSNTRFPDNHKSISRESNLIFFLFLIVNVSHKCMSLTTWKSWKLKIHSFSKLKLTSIFLNKKQKGLGSSHLHKLWNSEVFLKSFLVCYFFSCNSAPLLILHKIPRQRFRTWTSINKDIKSLGLQNNMH